MRKRLPRLPDDILPKLPLVIRRLTADDREALLHFYQRLSLFDRHAHFGHPLSDHWLARYVDRVDFGADGHFAALGAASVIIAVGHCIVLDGQGILSIHVASGYRRRGLGAGLRHRLVGFGGQRGLCWLRAYFMVHDEVAAALARQGGMTLISDAGRVHAELLIGPCQTPRGNGPMEPARLQSAHARAPTTAA